MKKEGKWKWLTDKDQKQLKLKSQIQKRKMVDAANEFELFPIINKFKLILKHQFQIIN